MFSIIDRYLLREALWNWLAVTFVLWLIVLSNRLARYLGEAASGDIPGSVIFTLLGLKSVNYLVTLLPLSLFLGVLLALGRLYKDSEMIAMQACGVGTRELYRPLLTLALLVGLALTGLSLYVAPHTAELGYQLRAEAEQATDLANVAAGQFEEGQGGQLIFYAERVERAGESLQGIFVRSIKTDPPSLMTADRARPWTDAKTGDRFIVLEDGYRYQGQPGDKTFRVVQFERHGLRIEAAEQGEVQVKQDATPTAQLVGSSDRRDIAELQWRLSLPLAAVILVILAVPLSRTSPRQGRYGRLFIAVLVFILYYNLLGTAQVWVERGKLPALPGLWWTHLLPLALAWWMWRRGRPGRPRRTA